MKNKSTVDKIISTLEEGLNTCNCAHCECMRITLESMIKTLNNKDDTYLKKRLETLLEKVDKKTLPCNQCENCYPANAMKLFKKTI